MHTIIEAHCTGCELCIPVCPVDCISLEVETPGQTGWQAWSGEQAEAALRRYRVHLARGATVAEGKVQGASIPAEAPDTGAHKRDTVAAALARARAAKATRPPR